MKYFLSIILLFTLQLGSTQSESIPRPYFQQEVNYTISGTLDDSLHTFTGEISMEYINNSPDELDLIYMHLWANAFKDRNSAFNRQKNRQGSTGAYFAKPKDRGNYTALNFTVDGIGAELNFEKNNPDIAKLMLPKPVSSKGKVIIKTPFKLKIPASFSRLGHVDQTYQMTQWFPKPAVYDREGWHPMPYLDMGEYYSEFGSFDVSLTLPENYVVGATGTLQTASEISFLEKKANESNEILKDSLTNDLAIPVSSEKMKTIRYTAENVHDFAWFADKRFYVQKSSVTLDSGKKIDTWAMFTNQEGELWKKGIEYVDRSVEFYSEMVGEYPYPQASAVQSALSAGGGMEYPMITVIGLMGAPKPLDAVITHEVGHNWFYGILGFNERDHAWLDEGINSYYDHRYLIKYYGDPSMGMFPPFIKKRTNYTDNELGTLLPARAGYDQPSSTHSDEFIPINYWIGAYEKPAEAFRYLQKYLGDYRFDRAMQSFYKAWEFKHPRPIDFQDHFTKNTGEDLSWFFDGFIYSTDQMDYALKAVEKKEGHYSIKAENLGTINGPFPIIAFKDSVEQKTLWVNGFEGEKEITFPDGDYNRFVIDANHWGIDINRKNNDVVIGKKGFPVHVDFLFGLEKDDKPTISIAPALGWNNYDNAMIGAVIFNKAIPEKKFEFALAPMFGTATKKLRGIGQINYNFYTKNISFLEKATLGFGIKSFGLDYNWNRSYYLDYKKFTPSIKLKLAKKKPASSIDQTIYFRSVILGEQQSEFRTDTIVSGGDTTTMLNFDIVNGTTIVHNLQYEIKNKRGINPWSLLLDIRQSSYKAFTGDESYLRASLTWKGEYTYDKGRAVRARIFAGTFLSNTRKNSSNKYSNVQPPIRGSFHLSGLGFNDELFDHVMFGRSDANGILSQQTFEKEGGFKNHLATPKPNGFSNKFMLSANLTGDLPQDLPFKIPLRPYLDLAYFGKTGEFDSNVPFKDKVEFAYTLGISVTAFDERLAIYFPLAISDSIRFGLPDDFKYLTRITWTADLNRINPLRLADELSF